MTYNGRPAWVNTAYNVCGLACILGLTSPNNQVSLTTKERIARYNGTTLTYLGQVRYHTVRRPPSSAYQDCEHQINRVGPKKLTQAIADLFYGLLLTYPREGTQKLT